MKISILDDEPMAVNLLERFAKKTAGVEVLHTYLDPVKALKELPENKPDVLFLDIRMPEISGFEFLSLLNTHKPLVVITTAFPEYSLTGYEFEVFDFLLKPFSYEHFLRTIGRLKVRIGESGFFVKSDRKSIQIIPAQIALIESDEDYIRVFYIDGPPLDIRLPMRSMEEHLPAGTFLRVHKSFLVNKNEVSYLEGNELILKNGRRIPLGRTYRSAVKKQIHNATVSRRV